MLGIETGALDTAGGVFMTFLALGCAWLGGLAVLRPHRPPQPIGGPVWVVRTWGFSYVLLGIAMAAKMTAMLVGQESPWAVAMLNWVAGPLVLLSVIAAGVSQWRARRRADGPIGGRHGRHK